LVTREGANIKGEELKNYTLCKDNKFYNHVCQVILFSLYFNKHTKLQELRNTVDGILQLHSKTALDDDTESMYKKTK
jgi:hypothetical protein